MLIVFDVDGTLLNTYPLVRAAYIHTFNKYLPRFQYDEKLLKSFFGPPLPETFRNVEKDQGKIELLITEYQHFSKKNADKYLSVYPHTQNILEYLKSQGHKIVVLSNKKTDVIKFEFQTVKILDYFDEIIGYDLINPKPNPDGIYLLQQKYPMKTLLVGDSVIDIQTAKNAKIIAVGVTWALTPKDALLTVGANYIIDDFMQLIEIVKEENDV